MTDEPIQLTKEEVEAERSRKVEKSQRRNSHLRHDLLEFVNKNPGIAQTLYYAREGQYGKDDKTFTRVGENSYGWYDSTEYKALGLAIFHSKAEILSALAKETAAMSYVIFKRTFTPQWTVAEVEVALIYDKGIK